MNASRTICAMFVRVALAATLLLAALPLASCTQDALAPASAPASASSQTPVASTSSSAAFAESTPAFEQVGVPYVELNGNEPEFSAADRARASASFEEYAPLDSLGRCGVAFALVGEELMPTEERGSIGAVKPSGWHLVRYDGIDGGYLFNRCHLIGYQLAGENANECNLITGTRYLNTQGMLPFENEVADYVHETGNHVLYRVTPVFDGADLVASGVQMEALSVEDNGAGVRFNVFCYNVQPGIEIDYATGDSWLADASAAAAAGTAADASAAAGGNATATAIAEQERDYVLNTNSMKFHDPACSSVADMSAKNRQNFHGYRSVLVLMGYEPCGRCQP